MYGQQLNVCICFRMMLQSLAKVLVQVVQQVQLLCVLEYEFLVYLLRGFQELFWRMFGYDLSI